MIYLFVGGGAAFLHASKELDKTQPTEPDKKIGVQLLQKALQVFVFQMFISSGYVSNLLFHSLKTWFELKSDMLTKLHVC